MMNKSINLYRIEKSFLSSLIIYSLFSWYIDANNIIPDYNLTPYVLVFFLLYAMIIGFLSKFVFNRFALVWLPFITLIMMNILLRYRLGISTALQLVIGFIFLLTSSANMLTIKKSINILKVISILFAITVIFHYLFPSIHMIFIKYLLNPESYRIVESLMNRGFYAGLSSQTGHIAAYLSIGIGLFFVFANKFNKRRVIFIGTIFVIALLLTGKRAHFLFSIVAFAITMLISSKQKVNTAMKILFLTIIIAGVLTIMGPYLNPLTGVGRVYDSFAKILMGSKIDDVNDITSGRLDLFQEAWLVFKQNIWNGIGWGYYGFSEEVVSEYTVHNVYLNILAELGIPGLIFYLIPLLWLIKQNIKLLKIYKNTSQLNLLKFTLYCQIFYLLYNFTGNPLYNFNYLFLYLYSIFILFKLYKNRNIASSINLKAY